MKRFVALLSSSLATLPALAHPGHGAAPLHWHATDSAGFALVALLAGVALWLSRGD